MMINFLPFFVYASLIWCLIQDPLMVQTARNWQQNLTLMAFWLVVLP
jgi:hypothetical protein